AEIGDALPGGFAGFFLDFDGVDVARAGLGAEAGEDGVAAGADLDDGAVTCEAPDGCAIALIAALIGGHRVVEQFIVDGIFTDGGPELDWLRPVGGNDVGDE